MTDKRQALEHYNVVRSRGSDAILRLAKLADERHPTPVQEGAPSRAETLRAVANELKDKVFTIAVVGEFSRGKSTLLNTLLGRPEMLPTSIMPSTSAITIISFTEGDEYANVKHKDGSVKANVPLGDLEKYVVGTGLDGKDATRRTARHVRLESEKEAQDLNLDRLGQEVVAQLEGGVSPVTEVEVYCNSPFLRDSIRLVDTPGIGSVNPEHGESTRSYIHNADSVIFLINTDPVISASECNFLLFLEGYVSNFIFAITKIDRFTEKERAASIAYTRQTIREYADIDEPRLFPVSARMYDEGQQAQDAVKIKNSGFPEFVRALDRYLIRERGKVVLENSVRHVRPHYEDLKRSVDLMMQSLDLDLDELRKRLEATRSVLNQAREVHQLIIERVDGEMTKVDEILQKNLDWSQILANLKKNTAVEIENYDWNDLEHASQLLPIFVRQEIQTAVDPTLQQIILRLTSFRKEMVDWCKEMLHKMHQDIPFTMQDALEWHFTFEFDADRFLDGLKKTGTMTIGSTLALALATTFLFSGIAVAIVIGGGLLAGTGVARALRDRTRRDIADEVQSTLDQLGAQLPVLLRDDIAEHLHQFRDQVINTLDSAIANVAETVSQLEQEAGRGEHNSQEKRTALQAQLNELESIGHVMFETRFWAGYVSGESKPESARPA